MSVVPLGVDPSCSPNPNPDADREADLLLGTPHPGTADLLHVGSTIPRKRIDILLRIVSELHGASHPVRLLRVGGPLTAEQRALARGLQIESAILELPFLTREVLSAVYRRSALVLQPSDAEGFGLPVAEAMACGTPVVASDLAVLREVGGEAASYCDVANVPEWASEIARLLQMRSHQPDEWEHLRNICLKQSSAFSWQRYTECMWEVYNKILARPE